MRWIYQKMVQKGELQADSFQLELASRLTDLEGRLVEYQNFWAENIGRVHYSHTPAAGHHPSEAKKERKARGFFSLFRGAEDDEESHSYASKPKIQESESRLASIASTPFDPHNIPKGIYIYGTSGTGKTLITSRWFDQLRVEKKSKAHFFEFMEGIHQQNFAHSKVG